MKTPPSTDWLAGRATVVRLLVGLGLALILGLGIYAYQVAATTAERLIASDSLSIATVAQDLVAEEFENLMTAATIVTETPAVIDATQRHDEEYLRRSLQVLVESSPKIIRAFVTDIDGRLWSDFPKAPESLGRSFSDRDWYKGISAGWTPYVSQVYQRNAKPRILLVAVVHPIRDPVTHEVIGILGAQVSLEALADLLGRINVGWDGSVLLFDPVGAVTAHPHLDMQLEIHMAYAALVPIVDALGGRTEGMRYFDPVAREEMLATAVPVEIFGRTWAVVAQQSLDAALGPTRRLAWQIGIAGMLVVTIVAGLGLALYRSFRHISRLAAAERQRLESTFHDLFSFTIDSLVLVGRDGKIVDVNGQAENTFGYTHDELVGQPVELLVPAPFRDDHVPLRDGYFRDPTPRPMAARSQQLTGRRKDGSTFPAEITLFPLSTGSSTIVAASVRDLSEKLAVETQLRQAQKMEAVGQLTGGLAHDFNNLMTVIIGNLDLLAARLKGDERGRALVQIALSTGLKASELTHRLLAFSRKQALDFTVVDVNGLVHGMTEMLRGALDDRIEIVMNAASDLWPVESDPSQLEAAILNLAVNARDAMPTGGRLTIETANRQIDERYAIQNPDAVPGDYVMLAVTDTGIGIPPEQIGRVFEPFFTTKEVGKGSGLGLSMVYGFVKQSGGHMKIEGEVGRGTTVRLYLPRSTAAMQPAEAQAAPRPEATVPGNELVLVVDDNHEVRSTVVGQLEILGYRTLDAADGNAAIALLKTEPGIDLLFTDIVMPGSIGGFQLAEIARKIRPGMPVLFTSGFAEDSLYTGEEKLPAGARLLCKPYRMKELAQSIRESLS